MVALAYQNSVPDHVAQEMIRLTSHGFNVIPLGGEDGKSPLCAFAGEPPGLSKSLGLLKAHHTMSYGIRLDGLLVVDADEATPDIEDVIRARFGPSPVQVATPRGRHFWYHHDGGPVPSLRGEGLAVDIKAGPNAYVLGPGSVRPDSGEYIAIKGRLGETALPEFQSDSGQSLPRPKKRADAGRIGEGSRNRELSLAAIQMVETVDTLPELFQNLVFIRDEQCENPETLPDEEIQKIAEWAWSKRLEGKVYRDRDSEFRLNRAVMDLLSGVPNQSDALALYVCLMASHGHIPGRQFTIDWQGMRANGHTSLGRRRFLEARRALESVGLVGVANEYSAGHFSRTYRLQKPLADDVTSLFPAKEAAR